MPPRYSNRFESSALFLSGLCVAHCLVLPLLVVAIPALAVVFELPDSIHVYIVALALPLSLSVLVFGAHQHKSLIPLVAGSLGLLSMTVALAAKHESAEVTLSVIGAVILAVAHISNWRRRSRCVADVAI